MKLERKTYFNFKIATILLLSGLFVFSFDLGLNQIVPESAYHSEWILQDYEESDFSFLIEKFNLQKASSKNNNLLSRFEFNAFLFCENLIQNVDYQCVRLGSNSFSIPSLFLQIHSLSRNFSEPFDGFLS